MPEPNLPTSLRVKGQLRIVKYIWDRGKPDSAPGALIRLGTHRIFVRKDQLRSAADQLHDIADDYNV